MSTTVTDLPDGPVVWLLDLGTAPPPAGTGLPEALGSLGSIGLGDAEGEEPAAAVTSQLIRVSDRGWIGEPDDADLPHVAYPARLVAPPALQSALNLLPEQGARGTYQVGEVALDNGDGALDTVGGDWTLAGRPAVLYRGPHRMPRRAPFAVLSRVAELRVENAPMGGDRLRVALRSATADLGVPVCGLYAGTGGLEGDAGLKGRPRPVLLGPVRNITPVGLLAASLIWQVAAGALTAISAVRDRGVALTAGANYATLAALQAAAVVEGTYATCLAQGLFRLGLSPSGQLTVDATGPSGTHGAAAQALITGPGGLASSRVVAAGFDALPGDAAGWLFADGTVEAAVDRVLASCAGWWGADAWGRYVAGRIVAPETLTPTAALEAWMLSAEPEEEPGTPPRWRQRVGYAALATVQGATDLAGPSGSLADRVAAYGTPYQVATAVEVGVAVAYPNATDPVVLVSGFRDEADAQSLAGGLLTAHGNRRRIRRLAAGRYGRALALGQAITVAHPRLAGRTVLVVGREEARDDVRIRVWG